MHLGKILGFADIGYPYCIVGHRDLPGVQKDCPCFEVK